MVTPDGQETIKNTARVLLVAKQNAGFDTFYDLRDPGISAFLLRHLVQAAQLDPDKSWESHREPPFGMAHVPDEATPLQVVLMTDTVVGHRPMGVPPHPQIHGTRI